MKMKKLSTPKIPAPSQKPSKAKFNMPNFVSKESIKANIQPKPAPKISNPTRRMP